MNDRYGGKLAIIAGIAEPEVIEKILYSEGIRSAAADANVTKSSASSEARRMRELL